MKYNFTFFASSQAYGDVNVAYIVNNKTCLLNASLNKTGAVTMYDIVPDNNGEVTITVTSGTPTSQFGLIGALIIQGHNISSVPAPPPPSNFASFAQGSTQSSNKESKGLVKENYIELSAHPNPFRSDFYLSVSVSQKENVQVIMYDMNGRVIYQNKFNDLSEGLNSFRIQPNNSSLAAGIYLVKVTFQNQNVSKFLKLVKD